MNTKFSRTGRIARVSGCVVTLLLLCQGSFGYSVMTHQVMVDRSWEQIKNVISARYGPQDEARLKRARRFAYGGCLIQDAGYFLNSQDVSNLLHYVRTGDFVSTLLASAQNPEEYAFALGALAHYAGDIIGHSMGTNIVVPQYRRDLLMSFGSVVQYDDLHAVHTQAELGFDVYQVATDEYPRDGFGGFEVATDGLERAFKDTYGVDFMQTLYPNAPGLFRPSVGTVVAVLNVEAAALFPDLIQKIMAERHRDLPQSFKNHKQNADESRRKAMKQLKGVILSFALLPLQNVQMLLRLLCYPGPFSPLVTIPELAVFLPDQGSPQEAQYKLSFERALALYRDLLQSIGPGNGILALKNLNLDTGRRAGWGEYRLADSSYKWMRDTLKGKSGTGDVLSKICEFFPQNCTSCP